VSAQNEIDRPKLLKKAAEIYAKQSPENHKSAINFDPMDQIVQKLAQIVALISLHIMR
jgi:hypothetical protein